MYKAFLRTNHLRYYYSQNAPRPRCPPHIQKTVKRPSHREEKKGETNNEFRSATLHTEISPLLLLLTKRKGGNQSIITLGTKPKHNQTKTMTRCPYHQITPTRQGWEVRREGRARQKPKPLRLPPTLPPTTTNRRTPPNPSPIRRRRRVRRRGGR